VALGLFAKLAAAYVAVERLAPGWLASRPGLRAVLLATVVLAGTAGVACSVMVYHVVRRPFWHASIAGWKFAGTALVLGLAAALACIGVEMVGRFGGRVAEVLPMLAVALVVASTAKLRFEARDLRGQWGDGPLGQTAWLLRNPLREAVGWRKVFGVAGGVVLPAMALAAWAGNDLGASAAAALGALAATVVGEFLERSLFFTAVSRPRMPGGLPS
jgi:formate dehydrogenase iron-sulfur subunit